MRFFAAYSSAADFQFEIMVVFVTCLVLFSASEEHADTNRRAGKTTIKDV